MPSNVSSSHQCLQCGRTVGLDELARANVGTSWGVARYPRFYYRRVDLCRECASGIRRRTWGLRLGVLAVAVVIVSVAVLVRLAGQ